jgi:hypothetical protein
MKQGGVATMIALQKLPGVVAQPGGSVRLMVLMAPASQMLLKLA